MFNCFNDAKLSPHRDVSCLFYNAGITPVSAHIPLLLLLRNHATWGVIHVDYFAVYLLPVFVRYNSRHGIEACE